MIRALALACLVASCAPPLAPVALPDLQRCAAGPSIPIPPAKPRTSDAISAWGNRDEAALRRARADLVQCEKLRDGLATWIERHK